MTTSDKPAPLAEVFLVYRVECSAKALRNVDWVQFVDSKHSEHEHLIGFCDSRADAEVVAKTMKAPAYYDGWNPNAEIEVYPQFRVKPLGRALVRP